jgi:urea transporter
MFQGNISLSPSVRDSNNALTEARLSIRGLLLFILYLEHFFLIPPAFLPGIDAGTLNMGLMGYNGVLCSIALGNKNLKSLVWTSCSVLLSVVLQVIGMNLGITTLTAPFVISVWVIMGIQKLMILQQYTKRF